MPILIRYLHLVVSFIIQISKTTALWHNTTKMLVQIKHKSSSVNSIIVGIQFERNILRNQRQHQCCFSRISVLCMWQKKQQQQQHFYYNLKPSNTFKFLIIVFFGQKTNNTYLKHMCTIYKSIAHQSEMILLYLRRRLCFARFSTKCWAGHYCDKA